jgi:hypothetical protein
MAFTLESENGQRYSAEKIEDIIKALSNGSLPSNSLIWMQSTEQWVPLMDFISQNQPLSNTKKSQKKDTKPNSLNTASKNLVKLATKGYLKITLKNRFSKALAAMLEDGKLELEELEALKQMVSEANADWNEIINECKPIAEKFVRHQLADATADGEVTKEEETEITESVKLFRLDDHIIHEVANTIKRLRTLNELRANRLPSPMIAFEPWLQSGESVYLQMNADLINDIGHVSSGALWITNTRVEYVAPKGGSSTAYKNLRGAIGRGCNLLISSVKGQKEYIVSEAEITAELLLCLLRANNRTVSVNVIDDTKSDRRRISKEVRNAVWIRDSGTCVECGANDYLEFDHIIPVAKGGGNTVNNIQLLCRKCNGRKSDRI